MNTRQGTDKNMAKQDKRSRNTPRGQQRKSSDQSHPADQPAALTGAQEAEVQTLLARVPALAEALRNTPAEDLAALSTQLAPIEAADESVQHAFATRLGDVRGPQASAAAEVANALGELAASREVARAARRARLRLRSAGALPTLALVASPGNPTPVAASVTSTAPRAALPRVVVEARQQPQLVEAHVTRSRDEGELALILAWQEGSDPGFVRGAVLAIDFWRSGVQSMRLTSPMRRQRFLEETVHDLRGQEQRETVEITWAQARRLLREALDVNAWLGVEPDPEYRRHQAFITSRLLDVPDTDEARVAVAEEDARAAREGDRPYIAADLEPDEVVANWLGAWTFRDYGLAYDLLADDHPQHRGQSRDEYTALRRQWAGEAKPAALRLTLVREQAQRASALWVPGAAGTVGAGARRDVEAFWSATLTDTPIGGMLDELPLATLTSAETGRHWYWTGYTVERDREAGVWRIARSRDEGAASQALSVEELQQRIQQAHAEAEKITATPPVETDAEATEQALRTLTGAFTSALHYDDVLIVKLPLDETLYRQAVQDAESIGSYERAAALLERMRARFPGQAHTSSELGIQYYLMAMQVARLGDAAAERLWLDRATAAFEQAIAIEPAAEYYQALGEIKLQQGHATQAIAQLRQAIALDPSRAGAHASLANALMGEVSGENLDETVPLAEPGEAEQRQRIHTAGRAALAELREAATLDRGLPRLYARMGAIYEVMSQPDDALVAFQQAVQQDPTDVETRLALGSLLIQHRQYEQATRELEEGARIAPQHLGIRLMLAASYIEQRRWREAERELNFVDELRPGLPQVADLRTHMERHKKGLED